MRASDTCRADVSPKLQEEPPTVLEPGRSSPLLSVLQTQTPSPRLFMLHALAALYVCESRVSLSCESIVSSLRNSVIVTEKCLKLTQQCHRYEGFASSETLRG
jgi:hypothetical protein